MAIHFEVDFYFDSLTLRLRGSNFLAWNNVFILCLLVLWDDVEAKIFQKCSLPVSIWLNRNLIANISIYYNEFWGQSGQTAEAAAVAPTSTPVAAAATAAAVVGLQQHIAA
jgi:hypothetical protein